MMYNSNQVLSLFVERDQIEDSLLAEAASRKGGEISFPGAELAECKPTGPQLRAQSNEDHYQDFKIGL